jgi:transposase
MDRASLESLSREQLIEIILAQAEMIARLLKRIEDLEAKLALPPKTPGNSSVPPSQSRKPSDGGEPPPKGKRRGKAHAGSHRELDPDPTQSLEIRVSCCPHCEGDVSSTGQRLCEAYDHLDIPPVQPVVTRVMLFGGVCPHCQGRFKAEAPADMPSGSPFGPNLRALVIYLRYTQGIAFERLARLLHDLYGLTISEGALINMLEAAIEPFAAQTERIRSRLLSSTMLESDETSLRVGKSNFWLWIVHHKDSAVFLADPTRAKRVLEEFLAGHRPDFWISDRYGGQKGFAAKEHQYCLAHLIRDAQYAVDAGDECFAPGLICLFKRACRLGRKRDQFTDRQLAAYYKKFVKKLSDLLLLQPTHSEGIKLQGVIGKIRRNLFVFVTNRDLAATNNESERSLRPCVTFRKITNGFRTVWGANLYADIRSVIETARRRAIAPLQAIILTLRGNPLLIHPA